MNTIIRKKITNERKRMVYEQIDLIRVELNRLVEKNILNLQCDEVIGKSEELDKLIIESYLLESRAM